MTCEISVTPEGNLVITDSAPSLEEERSSTASSWARAIAKAFSSQEAAGLFTLAASGTGEQLTPSISFWRAFSSSYLSELCRTPDLSTNGNGNDNAGSEESTLSTIEPPTLPQLEALLSSMPPMRGAEYVNIDVLRKRWNELDTWVRNEISASDETSSGWLKKHAPLWHQVGRVCFHLAENKRDQEYPFAFIATYAPKLSSIGRVQYQPLSRALQEHKGDKKALISLLSPVHLASQKSAFVRELVESNDIFHPLMWTPKEAYRFLKEAPLLEESGVLVRLPDWWRKRPRPRVNVTIGEKKQSLLGMDAMLDFKVGLAVGDTELTAEDLQQIMNGEEGLVYLKGQWIEVDQERLSEALAHWKEIEKEAKSGGISFIEGMRLLAGAPKGLDSDDASEHEDRQWSFVNAGSWLSDILSSLRDPSKLSAMKPTKSLQGTLRPYQQKGHEWLRFVSSLGLGACLADDMGLGKTIQVLSLLLSIKEEGIKPFKPSLLVLPASLLGNWKSEIERFAPTLRYYFVHPSEQPADRLFDTVQAPRHCLDPSPLSTTGGAGPCQGEELEKHLGDFDIVLTTYGMLLRQSRLLDMKWRLVILDEAQAIKNPSAQQTRAVKQLKSESRIALTGTPVENRLSDLWSLFDFLSPGLLGSAERFKRFVKKLDEQEHHSYAPLRNLVSPYILRRLKTDKSIISDLPDKTETKVFCGLSKEQAALYCRSVEDLKEALKDSDGIKRRGLVLSFLLRFKQICNHPSQLLGDGEYAPDKSGKFDRLKAICDEIASRQEKVLVFTQFKEMTDPLAAFLSEVFGRRGLVLHGGTAVSKRKDIVNSFQQLDGPPFVVLSLKAGGTGLNLTAASHVVHFDRWWNPAVENQATDRAYRIGQHRNVLVHKFICKGTIEEKIDKLIAEKTELCEGILGGGAESMLTEMSDDDLLKIVGLDLDRVSLD